MEATGLSVGKSVLNGALGYAKSALAEEVALQLGVRRDQAFITDELEMMQGFLMTAHEERDDNKVVKIWVKQVRDVAYNVEDCLQDFAVRLDKQSWWRLPLTLLDRRRVATEMKELRAKVEDVSQRNVRYSLIQTPGSRPAAPATARQPSIAGITMRGIQDTMKQEKSKVDLVQLINKKDTDLRVITVGGKGADLGQTSIIWAAYENPEIKNNFPCRAWVRLMHPFNPQDLIQSLVEQFHTSVGVDILLGTKKIGQELAEEFNVYVNDKKFLIVLNDLSTIEEWNRVKRCFPNNKKGSLIIVSTRQVEVASLCAGQESIVSELKQSSVDQNIYAFYEKGSQDGTDSTMVAGPSSKSTVTNSTDQSQGADWNHAMRKSFSHAMSMTTALEESHLLGRDREMKKVTNLIFDKAGEQLKVISVWGMGGLGKTTLVGDVYQQISCKFDKCACVTIMRPFILEELFRSLVMQLDAETSEKKDVVRLLGSAKKTLPPMMSLAELIDELARLIEEKRS